MEWWNGGVVEWWSGGVVKGWWRVVMEGGRRWEGEVKSAAQLRARARMKTYGERACSGARYSGVVSSATCSKVRDRDRAKARARDRARDRARHRARHRARARHRHQARARAESVPYPLVRITSSRAEANLSRLSTSTTSALRSAEPKSARTHCAAPRLSPAAAAPLRTSQ